VRTVYTELEINATKEKVWETLIDFSSYSKWNPLIIEATGELKLGSKLIINVKTPAGKNMKFNPEVVYFEEKKKFVWLGHLLVPGFFSGKHSFSLKDKNNSCKIIHKEEFSGFLVPLLWRFLEKDFTLGFQQMNEALKKRVEV